MVWMKQFPSPIGVLYISMKEKMITRTIVTTVSVPYWGSLYFNQSSTEFIDCRVEVSVPYWGSLYFNKMYETDTFKISFPSPIGVLYISIKLMNSAMVISAGEVSVPYWGSLYFNMFGSLSA